MLALNRWARVHLLVAQKSDPGRDIYDVQSLWSWWRSTGNRQGVNSA